MVERSGVSDGAIEGGTDAGVLIGRFIGWDGTDAYVSVPQHDHLSQLQALVGGNIEFVPFDPAIEIMMGEEARIFGIPTNQAITDLVWHRYGYDMVGDAVLFGALTGEGEMTSFPVPNGNEVVPWDQLVAELKEKRADG